MQLVDWLGEVVGKRKGDFDSIRFRRVTLGKHIDTQVGVADNGLMLLGLAGLGRQRRGKVPFVIIIRCCRDTGLRRDRGGALRAHGPKQSKRVGCGLRRGRMSRLLLEGRLRGSRLRDGLGEGGELRERGRGRSRDLTFGRVVLGHGGQEGRTGYIYDKCQRGSRYGFGKT